MTYTESTVIGLITIFSVILVWWIIQRQPIEARCGSGHMASKWVTLEAFDETAVVRLPVVDGKTDHCGECLSGMATRCARCGKPIFPYQPISVLSYDGDDFSTQVACLREECAGKGAKPDGWWVPPGRVHFDILHRRIHQIALNTCRLQKP